MSTRSARCRRERRVGVDASQGVEAQTLANCYLALDHNLEVVPILNKIDLPSADPDAVAKEVEDVIGLPCMEAPRVSAKLGIGVKDVLECVVRDVPAPTGDPTLPLKALIFDSIYDSYKGVIVYVRIFEGTVRPGDTIRLMSTGAEFQLVEIGHMGATSLTPATARSRRGRLSTASIKTARHPRQRYRHAAASPPNRATSASDTDGVLQIPTR
ncbi:MAG: GTP-binding protein [Gemmiger formicilis]|uniref:GTP-binding protein n=1 Tax=Gemmiger formicilis TaxID=745368 RepID=UPI00399656F2